MRYDCQLRYFKWIGMLTYLPFNTVNAFNALCFTAIILHQIMELTFYKCICKRISLAYFVDGILNSARYFNLLTEVLPLLLQYILLDIRQVMWYQYNGCPASTYIGSDQQI